MAPSTNEGLGHVVAEECSGHEPACEHEGKKDDNHEDGEGPLLADLLDVDLQPYAEHQQDQAEVLQEGDDLLLGHYGRVALVEEHDVDQDDAGDDVADQGRQLELVEDDGADRGEQREQRQRRQHHSLFHLPPVARDLAVI